MKTYPTERLRNVGLFSHGGAGKTSLAEAMLFNAGATTRLGKVDEGNTISDFDPDEIKRKISVQLAVLPIEWKDHKINLIDTPGYADFVGETREAARVLDAAVIVLDAVGGVEVGTEQVWRTADDYSLPRFVWVNKLQRENADFFRTVEQVRDRLSSQAVAIQIPIGRESDVRGVVDLISMKAYLGPKAEENEVPSEVAEQAATFRERLVETICETDDELIEKYLGGEEVAADDLVKALRVGTVAGKIVPILCGSGMTNLAVTCLLDAIVDYLPSPVDRGAVTAEGASGAEQLTAADSGPLAAFIFKTTADQHVGRISYLRVYSGVLRSNTHVWNSTRQREERLGQLFTIRGKTHEPVPQLCAGEIGSVAKLAETHTGDTLCTKEHQVTLPSLSFPNPTFSVAVYPKTKADLDKLGTALHRIAEEDPTLRLRREVSTNETVLDAMGDAHVDITVERMRRKFGVEVNLQTPKVPYKETIQRSTKAEYKHKKQTGGSGQYGHVFLEVEPLPGGGFEFAEKVVGGSVPRNFFPAVEKGVRESLGEGVLAGYPIVDVKVTLFDGSYHDVDSNEVSFKIASSQAFKKGLQQGNPVLLEPIVNLEIKVPEEFMGDVLSDLNGKRCRVLGMDTDEGTSTVHAQGPLAEVQRYSTDLRSITGGRGTYSMKFDHYAEVPAHLAQHVIDEAKKAKAEA
ncbi:MAG: elongation factor G [Chloroflexi bacterium]|nr:elongation factor G [Chloroflexota bacterium]